jgi:putative ATPase
VAVAAHHALEFVGLPEAKLNLAQAAAYLAIAPKSNASAVAIWRAEEEVKSSGPLAVPAHLRDSHAAASRMTGAGRDYRYPHDHGGWVAQQYLPDELRDHRLYEPITGREADLQERLDRARKASSEENPRPR